MGLILDTSILIARERRGSSIQDILTQVRNTHGETDIAISTISVIELTHGIYRARTSSEREQRRMFCQSTFANLIVHPLTLEIAELAGRIEGEQAAKGSVIPFEDLVIGATALHLGFNVLTLNTRHFSLIPALGVLTL